MPKGAKFPVVTSDNPKLKPWRQEIAITAFAEMRAQNCTLLDVSPVRLAINFVFQKPKSARKSALFKTTKPDLDKLIRAVCDALSGVVFRDDAQVAHCDLAKTFGEPSRTEITITELQP